MTPEDAQKLREPFKPEQIGKLPKAGITLDYVGHAAVTDRLLQVDPDWTWEYAPEYPAVAGGMWIRLTVCGVTRPGFGDGKNPKEWISDAIRNAAMRYGVALDLWSKQPLVDETTGSESSGPAVAPTATPHAGSEPFLTAADLDAMTGPQLIEALRERGLQLGGTVPEMRARLAAA